MSICINCNSTDPTLSAIECDGCHGVIHTKCVGVTEADIKMTRAKSRSFKVVCNNCNGNMSLFNDLKSLISTLKSDFCNALADLRREFTVKLSSLRDEIDGKLSDSGKGFDLEEVIAEVSERQARSSNVVVFGIPEQDSGAGAGDRAAADDVEVTLILKSINPAIEIPPSKVRRLGRFDPSSLRPRPVRVSLSGSEDVLHIVRNARKLKQSTCYTNISISTDKTPKQQDAYRQLKRQLDSRIANGEKNIKIRYIRGIPRITNLN